MATLLEKALAAAAGSVVVLDPELKIVFASSGAEKLLGVGLPSGVPFAKLVCGESVERPIAEALSNGKATVALVDGLDGPVKVRVEPIKGEEGVEGWLVCIQLNAALAAGVVDYEGMRTQSVLMKELFASIDRIAPRDTTVLIRGGSGTGKELVAQAIHKRSSRHDGPFVAINCAALPPQLLESELFGHVRGSFTGAVKDFPGRFRLANKGTIFMDEIAELPLEIQAKLLRVVQERSVIPLGGREPIPVDVRIVSATHRSLRAEVEQGNFRADLMYRIRVIPIFLSSLAEREGDVTLLARHFVRSHIDAGEEGLEGISEAACRRLEDYDWPGNIRELKNVIEYAVAMREGEMIRDSDLPPEIRGGESGPMRHNKHQASDKRNPESERIMHALERAAGHRGRAAEMLGISRATLWRKMRTLGLSD